MNRPRQRDGQHPGHVEGGQEGGFEGQDLAASAGAKGLVAGGLLGYLRPQHRVTWPRRAARMSTLTARAESGLTGARPYLAGPTSLTSIPGLPSTRART